jgi:hypothetical protein
LSVVVELTRLWATAARQAADSMADSWEDHEEDDEQQHAPAEAHEEDSPLYSTQAQEGTAAGEQQTGVDLTGDGGVIKTVLRAAAEGAASPSKEDYVCVGERALLSNPFRRECGARTSLASAGPTPSQTLCRVREPQLPRLLPGGGVWGPVEGLAEAVGLASGTALKPPGETTEAVGKRCQCITWARWMTARSSTAAEWTRGCRAAGPSSSSWARNA